MKWIKYSLYFLFFLFSFSCFSQNNKDSLLGVFNSQISDSNRISALHEFIKSNYSTPDTAIKYAEIAIDFSKKNKKILVLAKSYNLLAVSYYYQGDLIKSRTNLNTSLKYYTQLKDKSGMATCYNGIGVIHYDQGKLYEALQLYIQSLRIKEKLEDKPSIAMTLNNIGNVFKTLFQIPMICISEVFYDIFASTKQQLP